MAAVDRTTLKKYFETGDMPTAAQFIDLIDSFELVAGFVVDGNTGNIVTHNGDAVTTS